MSDYNDEAAYTWWYQTGADKERERIISLLRDNAYDPLTTGVYVIRLVDAIALIKGETE